MAGIYIHIPFCRKACHYCNFHFSTSHQLIPEVVEAICEEALMQREYITELIETIYFGGGTPSLLSADQLQKIMHVLRSNFNISSDAEVTLESNPDDIKLSSLQKWKQLGFNRLSIGVQSFFENDLQWMNRAHNAQQSLQAIELAIANGFNNITIDLIYGTPGLTEENWRSNIQTAIDLNIPHISCYALTVEEGTALHNYISKGKMNDVDPQVQSSHFSILTDMLQSNGYRHYEISNFAKPGFESRHNSNYWKSKPYLGLGPSAHSYDGNSRQWNVANNALYVQAITNKTVFFEKEILTKEQVLNEKIMIALRTSEGLDLNRIETEHSKLEVDHILQKADRFLKNDLMEYKNEKLILTEKGKFLADGIASDLFF